MIDAMRRWFVLVLIVLLPLRGWVGEAMAGEMLAQHLQGIAATAPQPAAAPAVDHDCAGHGSESPADAAPATHDTCPTCGACQVCSAVALAFDDVSRLGGMHAPALAAVPRVDFASAEPTAAFKPPIS